MHDDQLDIDEKSVRALIAEQFPQWTHEPVTTVRTAATVNAIFRVGPNLAARFPLRAGDPDVVRRSLTSEATAAKSFADVAPVPAPVPVAIGEPGHGYPLPWSLQTWLPGCDALVADPAGSTAFATDLAALLKHLRAADTGGRVFAGAGRGGQLPDHDEWMAHCFDRSIDLVDVPALRRLWAELRALPVVDADVMCHGDLTPPNVLVDSGRLAGVLDTGGFAPADPALDLVSAWHLLDAEQRSVFRQSLPCTDVQWRRGMAWALQQAMGLVWYYATSNPAMSAWGRRTLDRLLAAVGGGTG